MYNEEMNTQSSCQNLKQNRYCIKQKSKVRIFLYFVSDIKISLQTVRSGNHAQLNICSWRWLHIIHLVYMFYNKEMLSFDILYNIS